MTSKDPLDKQPRNINKKDFNQLVSRLKIEEREVEEEALTNLIEELDTISVNSKAVLRKFKIIDNEGIFEHLKPLDSQALIDPVQNLLVSGRFFRRLMISEELNRSIDGLNTEDGFSGKDWNVEHEPKRKDKRNFDFFRPVQLDGYFADLLVSGGAYDNFDGTDAEAKELARKFEDSLMEGRHDDFFTKRLENVTWSEWFKGTPHWDETLFITDTREKLVWIFMFTATD